MEAVVVHLFSAEAPVWRSPGIMRQHVRGIGFQSVAVRVKPSWLERAAPLPVRNSPRKNRTE
jgi:hypothetical protein